MDKEQEQQLRELRARIESAAASLLNDEEICKSCDITEDQLVEHYDVVERSRVKLKQKLNARRVVAANQTGNADDVLRDIPANEYRRKNPRTGTLSKEGVVVGRGDNKTVVPPDEVYKLARLGCTLEEISDWFGVPRETLKYNFNDLLLKARSETRQSLRRAQIKLALQGNAAMLIWLGKNMLQQGDQGPVGSDQDNILPWSDE